MRMFASGFKPKSTTKEAIKLIRDEINDNFDPSGYDPKYNLKTPLDVMHLEAESYSQGKGYEMYSDWTKGSRLVEGGAFRIYYDDQADFLKQIYGDSVKNWSNDKIYNTYKSLIGREYARMLREQNNKKNRR